MQTFWEYNYKWKIYRNVEKRKLSPSSQRLPVFERGFRRAAHYCQPRSVRISVQWFSARNGWKHFRPYPLYLLQYIFWLAYKLFRRLYVRMKWISDKNACSNGFVTTCWGSHEQLYTVENSQSLAPKQLFMISWPFKIINCFTRYLLWLKKCYKNFQFWKRRRSFYVTLRESIYSVVQRHCNPQVPQVHVLQSWFTFDTYRSF